MAFVFSREGLVDEFGAAEELAEAPEAIEMHVVLWHVARYTGAEDFEGTSAALGIGREGLSEVGGEGIAEELGREGIEEEEALGLRAGFLGMAFFGLLAEASTVAAAAAESSLNFLTASFATLANLAWRLTHSSG